MEKAKRSNRISVMLLALLVVFSMLSVPALAAQIPWQTAYETTGDHLENQPHTVGAEWVVLGLCRSGRGISPDYGDLLKAHIKAGADESFRLHQTKSTVNSRMIVTLTAMGKDATDVDGIDLVAGLGSMAYVKKQGLNGVIWTLIALDSGNYAAPGDVSREALLQIILGVECSKGGWAMSGGYADADMTGMALQALAPYYDTNPEVKAATDRAVEELSRIQKDNGGFSTRDTATSESIAQVVVALTALGIDPDTDERFIKNGSSAIDALLAYYVEGGGFRHILTEEENPVATEQGYYALTAYARFREGKSGLYDMTDVLDMGGGEDVPALPDTTVPTETRPAPTEPGQAGESGNRFPWAMVVVAVMGTVALVILCRKKQKK